MTNATTQDKLDTAIATLMHCRARRADPHYSYEGVAVLKAIYDLTEIDAVHDAAVELEGELDSEQEDRERIGEYLASAEAAAASIRGVAA
ncbi:hypothetical protein AB1K62_14530 [Parasphingorhabdus sp. JC815]|uniref:hypothetical protein n=1 Tax=Parasphingorhabdus sp. JC815 TaxID=3232140 RepID=UPI003458ED1A